MSVGKIPTAKTDWQITPVDKMAWYIENEGFYRSVEEGKLNPGDYPELRDDPEYFLLLNLMADACLAYDNMNQIREKVERELERLNS